MPDDVRVPYRPVVRLEAPREKPGADRGRGEGRPGRRGALMAGAEGCRRGGRRAVALDLPR